VKAFFLPLMLWFATADMRWWIDLDVGAAISEPRGWFTILYRFIFFADVTWAAVGYIMTLKLIDGHIRSTEPTVVGWVVCLACYPPFWNFFYTNYAAYEEGFYWGNWLDVGSVASTVWGVMILVSVYFYVWSTLSFGIRFSNLTHRGIITSGPFRLTKHPGYIAKNIAWWLISVPFVSESGFFSGVQMCLLLLVVNSVYYFRAKTEERHLSADPVYREYCAWIAQYGLIAKIRSGAIRLLYSRAL
jgi:protein-S-isoprenylcysteine O-methyltransferase Ste14